MNPRLLDLIPFHAACSAAPAKPNVVTLLHFSDNSPNSMRWTGGMKGKNGSTDEGGVRSVCYVRWPATLPAGRTVTQVAGAIDLLRTLTALAAVKRVGGQPLDGQDFTPPTTRLLGGTSISSSTPKRARAIRGERTAAISTLSGISWRAPRCLVQTSWVRDWRSRVTKRQPMIETTWLKTAASQHRTGSEAQHPLHPRQHRACRAGSALRPGSRPPACRGTSTSSAGR